MIVQPKPGMLGIFFTLKGSIVKRIAVRCLMITILASLVVLVEGQYPEFFCKLASLLSRCLAYPSPYS